MRTLVQEQAAALYRLNMEQYASLKGQLLAATAVGCAGGFWVAPLGL